MQCKTQRRAFTLHRQSASKAAYDGTDRLVIVCSSAGKGWYNLNESNYETYCFSKMKSLLAVTRFMMEDTLRSLVLDNHVKYVAFVNAACGAKVTMLALHVPNSIPLHSDVVMKKAARIVQNTCSCF